MGHLAQQAQSSEEVANRTTLHEQSPAVTYMARSDSILLGLFAIAQLMLWQALEDYSIDLAGNLFGVSGATTALLAIYFLTSVGRYQKEFDASYSKLEKTRLERGEDGALQRVDNRTLTRKAGWWAVPIVLIVIGSLRTLGMVIS